MLCGGRTRFGKMMRTNAMLRSVSGSPLREDSAECSGNSRGWRMTFLRLSGFSIRRDAIETYDRTTPCPVWIGCLTKPGGPMTRTGALGATRGGRLVVGYHPAAS